MRRVTNTSRVCLGCEKEKPIERFRSADGKLRRYCDPCRNQRRANAKSMWARTKRYGITAEVYEEMLEQQSGRCAICGNLPGKRKLAVDHDHATGEVRALLCMQCNVGLGNFQDNIELLVCATSYLREHQN